MNAGPRLHNGNNLWSTFAQQTAIKVSTVVSKVPFDFFVLLLMTSTSAGSITLSGVAILQSPRAVDPQKGPRNVVFDANFCIVEGSQTVTMALLRYFHPTGKHPNTSAFVNLPTIASTECFPVNEDMKV